MGEPVTWRSPRNADIHGHLEVPPGDGPVPAVLVAHEWYGLNDHVRDITRRLAAEGFLALAVDFYGQPATADDRVASERARALKSEDAILDVAGAVEFLRGHPRSNGKVGMTGFCLGGALTNVCACHVPGLSACAPFYGLGRRDLLTWKNAEMPIEGHYARHDTHIPIATVEQTFEDARAAGSNVTLHVYDAGHAFMRDGDPRAWHEPSAKLAWGRLVGFMQRNLVA